jgi:hypothetical protein
MQRDTELSQNVGRDIINRIITAEHHGGVTNSRRSSVYKTGPTGPSAPKGQEPQENQRLLLDRFCRIAS